MTVGFFEVDERDHLVMRNPGMVTEELMELGSDTGQTERHRGFYLLDRSIPVAFEPGENHNIENAILIETMIK